MRIRTTSSFTARGTGVFFFGMWSRNNVRRAAELGARPVIALKSNTVGHNTQMMSYRGDDSAWRALWHLYNLRRDEFLATHHAGSNAESTILSHEARIRRYVAG